jgi:hypothetical protein
MRRSLIVLAALALFVGMALPASARAEKTPIAGDIILTGGTPADTTMVTPSGVVQERGGTAVTTWTGDVGGTVTFYYQSDMISPDGFRVVANGPLEGEVTWEGHTGTIRGMFTTNCKPTDLGPNCTGYWTAHGSGELAGVKFQMRWGDGWFPFTYEGYALDTRA